MSKLALLLLLSACARPSDPGRASERIPLPGALVGALRLAPVAGTALLIAVQREEPADTGDGLYFVDLERESAQELKAKPASLTLGFGSALCVASDGRRVLVGASSATHTREPGKVLAYRWPEFELEFEVRGDSGGDGFGTCICEIADVDGDARPDYVVGAPKSSALVVFSGADGHTLRRIEGEGFGWALSTCADCDGDGVSELAVLGTKGLELRSARDLHLLRTLPIHGGMFPNLLGSSGLALMEDDGGSWAYSSHKTVSAWTLERFEPLCQWKPHRYAQLYASPGSPCGARLAFPDGGALVSSDVCGNDERELARCGDDFPRALCELSRDGPTRWRTAIVLGLRGGRGNELLLTTR
jgi:hypothetical protein